MKVLLTLLAVFSALLTNAQPYSISFSGTGLSTVKVQNLTTGFLVDVPAGSVLRLSTSTGIPEIANLNLSGLKVYPNPMTDRSTIELFPPVSGDVIISVYDMTGKVLTQLSEYVENSSQVFNLTGIGNGIHIINVKGNGYQFSEKLHSNGKSYGKATIVRVSKNIKTDEKKISKLEFKGIQAIVDMTYNAGERLKYTAVSDNNCTVSTDIPTADKTVNFTFTECKDGDNNYYQVVQINNQLWMAENLRTTKFKDGTTSIPNITVDASWTALSGPGYCWYGNTESNKNIFGALYNFFTVSTGNLCPLGWHVPGDTEWTSLITFLGGADVAGSKLKETGSNHWNSPNTDATNESGFTALPGGYRYGGDGTFARLSGYGHWWSSSTWYRWIECDHPNITRTGAPGSFGFSIRCVQN